MQIQQAAAAYLAVAPHGPEPPHHGTPAYTRRHGFLCTFHRRPCARRSAALPAVRPEQPVRHHRRPGPGKLLVHDRRCRPRRTGSHPRSPAPPILPVPTLRRRAISRGHRLRHRRLKPLRPQRLGLPKHLGSGIDPLQLMRQQSAFQIIFTPQTNRSTLCVLLFFFYLLYPSGQPILTAGGGHD